MAEFADASDLKSEAFGRGGSNPPGVTTTIMNQQEIREEIANQERIHAQYRKSCETATYLAGSGHEMRKSQVAVKIADLQRMLDDQPFYIVCKKKHRVTAPHKKCKSRGK